MVRAVPILTFHALDDRGPAGSFPPELFQVGMRRLHSLGFRGIGVAEAVEYLQGGGGGVERPIAISFDDGYRTVFGEGLPVLEELGFRATVFVNGPDGEEGLGRMEGRERLTWRELEALRNGGFEIAAHTLSHPNLLHCDEAGLEAELGRGKEWLERRSGVRIGGFAYPFGAWDQRVRAAAAQHFSYACTTGLRVARAGDDVYALPRLEMHYFRSLRAFRLLEGPGLGAYLALRRGPRLLGQKLRPWLAGR